jgi:hypothetical protein
MLKKILPYFYQVLMIDLLISPISTFFFIILVKSYFPEIEISLSTVLVYFVISFLTGGYLLGVLFFELARKNEYYFYFNLGISKLRLVLTTYLFHIILIIPLLIIAIYAKHF